MLRRTKHFWVFIFCILIAAVAVSAVNCTEEGEPLPVPGHQAPDFGLKNLDGESVSLREFRGSPVMLNFWATWCGSCRFERPFIQQVYEDPFWKAEGLVILAVNLGESPAAVRGFIEGGGYTFPVLLDTTGAVGNGYNVSSIPRTFFIDESGIIKYIDIGPSTSKADLEQRLFELIIDDE